MPLQQTAKVSKNVVVTTSRPVATKTDRENKKASLKQNEQLKDVCMAKATAFPRNCEGLPLIFQEELLGVFPVQLLLDDTFKSQRK